MSFWQLHYFYSNLQNPTNTLSLLLSSAAYQTSCLSSPINGTLLDASRPAPDTFKSYKALFAITVPPDWDGPFGQGLSMAATVITVIAGAGLGAGMIGVLISM